jgi:hypothetical protein
MYLCPTKVVMAQEEEQRISISRFTLVVQLADIKAILLSITEASYREHKTAWIRTTREKILSKWIETTHGGVCV